MFQEYDLRFVYQAPAMSSITRRHVWDPESPALSDARAADIDVRVGEPLAEDVREVRDEDPPQNDLGES